MGDKHNVVNISANFRTILNGLNEILIGVREKLIHEKNLKSKILCQASLEELDFPVQADCAPESLIFQLEVDC